MPQSRMILRFFKQYPDCYYDLYSTATEMLLTNVPSKLCARTQVMRQAHSSKLWAQKSFFQKNFCTYFLHFISHTD